MKAYYYLLYRIYSFYVNKMKEEQVPLVYVTSISTILIFINLFSIYGLLSYYNFILMLPNKYYVITSVFIIWILNYLLFVRDKKFLNYDFRKNNNGSVLIIIYFLLTVAYN